MKTLIYSPNPLTCPICLEDDKPDHFKWHPKERNSHKIHSSCIDCTSLIFHKLLQENKTEITCLLCRKISVVKYDHIIPLAVLRTTIKTSLVFLSVKFILEPGLLAIMRSIGPQDSAYLALETWTHGSKTSIEWQSINQELKLLSQTGCTEDLINGLYQIMCLNQQISIIPLISLFLAAQNFMHEEAFNEIRFHNIQIAFLLQMCLFFGHTFFKSYAEYQAMLDADTFLNLGMNPLRSAASENPLTETLLILGVAFLPIIIASSVHLALDRIDLSTVEKVKKALLNQDLEFESLDKHAAI